MANIKVTPQDCEFFIEIDPYNFETDNRPLTNLLNNDILINAELETVRNEVVQARTGVVSDYDTLDLRLDAMENSIGASVSIDDMTNIQGHQYGDFLSNSEALRRASPSGFLDHGGIADVVVGDRYDDFAGVITTSTLGADYPNTIVLWTGWGSYYKPIRALVNGWIVRLFNEFAGSPPETVLNHIAIELGSAPSTSKYTNFVFLEVWLEEIDKDNPEFYSYGSANSNSVSTDDHLNPDVVNTVKAMAPGGNWIQVRHRIRVVQNIDPSLYPNGYAPSVLAQGAQGSPIATYQFSNMADVIDDSGLWRAGAGDLQSIADLGTYDGYSYSIPIGLFHRRNSGNFSITNQNGSADADVVSSGTITGTPIVSGRPDNLLYDSIDQRDILDLRNRISLNGFNYQAEMDRTWQMLIRGELRTGWKELVYDYDNNGTWAGASIWGHTHTVIDQITNNVSLNPDQLTNPLRDKKVNTAPLSAPDGQRNVWGKNATAQFVKFSFTEGINNSVSPSGFVTYNSGTQTLTFNAASLSGAGVGGTIVGNTPPIIMKKSSLISKPALTCSGLGTQAATVVMSSIPTQGVEYVGFVQVIYPGGSGITYPHKTILSHEVLDSGTVQYLSEQMGTTGSPAGGTSGLSSPRQIAKTASGKYVIADKLNHRVIRVDPTTWTVDAQFGVTGEDGVDYPGSPTTHLSEPVGVAVAPDDTIWVADTGLHRVVKLNASLNYVDKFGVNGVSGSDNTHLNSPRYLAIETTKYNLGTGGVYVTDCYSNRIVELASNLTKQGQFGGNGTNGTKGSGKTGLYNPTGIAIVTAGFGTGIWVADTENKRVVVLNTSLVFQYQICNNGNSNILYHPEITDVTVDSAGNIYVCCGGLSTNDNHVIYKYNQYLSKVAQFGYAGSPGDNTPPLGQPGSTPTHLRKPSGLALDDVNGWLYVCDSQNHRLLRLSTTEVDGRLPFLMQFGITGKSTGSDTSVLCPYPADVSVDSVGNVYVACNEVHIAMKLTLGIGNTLTLNAGDRFGVFGQSGSDNSHLKNPIGIAVNSAGTIVMIADFNNKRVVKLNGSMDWSTSFVPTYSGSATEIIGLLDVEYSPANVGATDGAGWWVSVIEQPVGGNGTNIQFAILKFADTPVGTPNYTRRIKAYDYPFGLKVTNDYIIAGTNNHGLEYIERVAVSDPNQPIFYTVDPTTTIFFKFVYPIGIHSDGTHVLVSEPQAHCVHCFSSDAAIYRGTAGVIFESGDDDAKLNSPHFAMLDGERVIISDTQNHRILRRHVSSPWVSSDGTVTSMLPPVSTDKIFIYYETEAYQGVINQFNGGVEAIFKSQIKHVSPVVYATTMGLGNPLTVLYNEFAVLRGMTVRLPLPTGWFDYDISPVGMKIGTVDSDDDGPFVAVPVVISEGFMGGQILTQQRGLSALTSAQSLQQVVRTVGGSFNPITRGFRSLLPRDRNKPVSSTKVESGNRVLMSPSTPVPGIVSPPMPATRVEVVRYGVPPVKSYNLLEAVPHFNYYPFFYQRKGVLLMGVVAEATNDRSVSIGTYDSNAIDVFFPQGRLLTR